MKEIRYLNLSLLEEVKTASIFSKLTKDLDLILQELPHMAEFYQRAQSAIMFFTSLESVKVSWKNEAHIRAGLNEFYSLEDAARRAFRNSSALLNSPSISESSNPLVHIMYSLRHINVHVRPSITQIENITFTYSAFGNSEEFTHGAVMLADDVIRDLLENKEVKKHYCLTEITASLDWLFEKQQVFGVGEIFRIGLETYVREVIACLEKK